MEAASVMMIQKITWLGACTLPMIFGKQLKLK
jgi:hypothetical protein